VRSVYLPRGNEFGAFTVSRSSGSNRRAVVGTPHTEADLQTLDPYSFLAEHPDLSMTMAPLPDGERGRWYPDLHVILISDRLSQAERRCTLAHELVHRMRGDLHVADDLMRNRIERSCHLIAARLLIPLPDLVQAMLWSQEPAEVAEQLWVDLETLQTRVETLHPAERGYLRRRLATKEMTA